MSTPVPHTGSRRRWHRRSGRNSGVSGNSRVMPHQYADEGDKGQLFRRQIRRIEKALWRREVGEE